MSMTKTDRQSLKPAGKFMFEELGQRWHHVKHGEAQITEPRLDMVKLYTESDVQALLDELEAKDKQIDILRQDKDTVIDTSLERINKILSRAEAAEKRIAELEARDVKPVAWMRSANVTSFMSRFTTDENYAVEQWGDDAVALYSLPVAFIPACFTDERNLMHINERGRATSLIWSEHNSDSGDIKLFRIAAAAGEGE